MIMLTRMNRSQVFVNAEMIQIVESTPDTVVTLTDKTILIVKESAAEVAQRVIAYKQQVMASSYCMRAGLSQQSNEKKDETGTSL